MYVVAFVAGIALLVYLWQFIRGRWADYATRPSQKAAKPPGVARLPVHPVISLEQQLEVLSECGIRLLPGVEIEHFLLSWKREEYEKTPYKLALVKLGGEIEKAPWGRRLSNNIWHFDTECIEDKGDYAAIAERLTAMAGSDLPLTNIADHVDVQEESAWVEFDLDGQRIHWDAKVENDWIDATILSRFAELMAKRKAGRRFTYCDLKGQDCLIGCCSPQQLQMLRSKTGLNFTWLT
jgi:hypothetical protein